MTFPAQRRLMDMKKMLITATFLFIAFLLHAQREKDTLYGFQQRIIPGTKAAGDIDETGKLIKKETDPVYQYTIYLATHAKTPLQPIQIWINGKALSFSAEQVNEMQVQQGNLNSNTAETILNLKTGAHVYKLTPIPLVADKSSRKLRAKAKEAALVVCYKTGKKARYAVLEKFTDLGALSMP
jgi:hypothetical protein